MRLVFRRQKRCLKRVLGGKALCPVCALPQHGPLQKGTQLLAKRAAPTRAAAAEGRSPAPEAAPASPYALGPLGDPTGMSLRREKKKKREEGVMTTVTR